MRRTLAVPVLLALSACTTVRSAYLTNLSAPAESGHPIEAESSKTVFLAMNFSNEYAFEARKKLYEQCPGGTVTGVLSTYETHFYVFVTTHVVHAKAYCMEARPKQRHLDPVRQTTSSTIATADASGARGLD